MLDFLFLIESDWALVCVCVCAYWRARKTYQVWIFGGSFFSIEWARVLSAQQQAVGGIDTLSGTGAMELDE